MLEDEVRGLRAEVATLRAVVTWLALLSGLQVDWGAFPSPQVRPIEPHGGPASKLSLDDLIARLRASGAID
jgi:hypothetical protein